MCSLNSLRLKSGFNLAQISDTLKRDLCIGFLSSNVKFAIINLPLPWWYVEEVVELVVRME